jgi:hypothetical protein
VPGEPNAAQHVDLVETEPVLVRNLLEGPGLEDPEVIDQDIERGDPRGHLLAPGGGAKIRGHASQRRAGEVLPDERDGSLDPLGGAAVDDDIRALAGEHSRGCEADARRRTGDQGAAVSEAQLHSALLAAFWPEDTPSRETVRSS